MARNKPYSGATVLAFLVSMLAMALLVACQVHPTTPPLDLRTVQPCTEEDGSGPEQTYPCVFDAMERNSEAYVGSRWTVYVNGPCNFATLQDETSGVTCIDVREWDNS
jgi:hypothetical protein